jgi:hypothetical protein
MDYVQKCTVRLSIIHKVEKYEQRRCQILIFEILERNKYPALTTHLLYKQMTSWWKMPSSDLIIIALQPGLERRSTVTKLAAGHVLTQDMIPI